MKKESLDLVQIKLREMMDLATELSMLSVASEADIEVDATVFFKNEVVLGKKEKDDYHERVKNRLRKLFAKRLQSSVSKEALEGVVPERIIEAKGRLAELQLELNEAMKQALPSVADERTWSEEIITADYQCKHPKAKVWVDVPGEFTGQPVTRFQAYEFRLNPRVTRDPTQKNLMIRDAHEMLREASAWCGVYWQEHYSAYVSKGRQVRALDDTLADAWELLSITDCAKDSPFWKKREAWRSQYNAIYGAEPKVTTIPPPCELNIRRRTGVHTRSHSADVIEKMITSGVDILNRVTKQCIFDTKWATRWREFRNRAWELHELADAAEELWHLMASLPWEKACGYCSEMEAWRKAFFEEFGPEKRISIEINADPKAMAQEVAKKIEGAAAGLLSTVASFEDCSDRKKLLSDLMREASNLLAAVRVRQNADWQARHTAWLEHATPIHLRVIRAERVNEDELTQAVNNARALMSIGENYGDLEQQAKAIEQRGVELIDRANGPTNLELAS